MNPIMNRLGGDGIAEHSYPSLARNVALLSFAGLSTFLLFLAELVFLAHRGYLTIGGWDVTGSGEPSYRYFLLFAACIAYINALVLLRIRAIPKKLGVSVVLIWFFVTAVVAVLSFAVSSQDSYWSLLLAKGLTFYHQNPYTHVPAAFASDPWYVAIQSWQNSPMVYGPLWVAIITPITYFLHTSLWSAFVALKLVYLCCLLVSGYFFLRVLAYYRVPDARAIILLASLALNPFLIQMALVDGHNDVIVMMLVIIGYYLFLRKRFVASIIVFGLGTYIKYTPALLAFLPVLALLRDTTLPLPVRIKRVALAGVAVVSLGVLLYESFGLHESIFAGLANEVGTWGASAGSLDAFGALILQFLFNAPAALIRLTGVATAFGIFFWYEKNDPLRAAVFSYLGLFFFLPWFQPWYLLWILPLFLLAVPFDVYIFTLFALLLTPEFIPALLLIAIPIFWYLRPPFTSPLLSE